MTSFPDPALSAAVSLALEHQEEKARLRRSRFRWRVGAVVAGLLALGALAALGAGGGAPSQDHIARVSVEGVITSDPERDRFLRDLAEDKHVKGVVLRIDSPGGTVVGSEELYLALRDLAKDKPIAATAGEMAASGGYITALGADRIFARGNSLVGSIGVISQTPNAYDLMEKIGVKMLEVKSDPLKAAPSPFQPVDPAAVAADAEIVKDSHAWFLGLVAERRGLTPEKARALGDGRVYTGRQGLEAGLIDAIGGEAEARGWLEADKGLPKDLEIIDRAPPEPEKPLLRRLMDEGASVLAQKAPQSGLLALKR